MVSLRLSVRGTWGVAPDKVPRLDVRHLDACERLHPSSPALRDVLSDSGVLQRPARALMPLPPPPPSPLHPSALGEGGLVADADRGSCSGGSGGGDGGEGDATTAPMPLARGKAAKRGPMRAKAGAAEADAPAESPIGLTVDTGTTDSAGSAGLCGVEGDDGRPFARSGAALPFCSGLLLLLLALVLVGCSVRLEKGLS